MFTQPAAQIISFLPELGTFDRALLLDERGDSGAEEFYRKAIDSGESIADSYCNLGIIESQRNNTAKAVDCFTTSLKHDPRHTESHYNLGNLYFELNDFRLAQIHFEIAAEIETSFPSVFFNLALVRAINGDFKGSAAALTDYEKLVPGEEARNAEAVVQELKESLAAA